MMSRIRQVFLSLVLGAGLLVVLWLLPRTGSAQPAETSSVGGAFPIATVPGNDEFDPVVAYDEGRNRYLVVNYNEGTLNGVCINADGDTVASYVIGSGSNPDVVYNARNDQYLVVWDNADNIEGAYVSGSCCLQVGCNSAPFIISGDRPRLEYNPAVAYNHHPDYGDYLVVWEDDCNQPDRWAIYARRVTSLTVSGSSFAITETANVWNYEPDVTYNLNHNEYLVVYTNDPSAGLDQTARNIYARRVYNAGGGGLLAEHAIDTSGESQDQPSVAAYHLNFSTPYVVVFRDRWNDAWGDVRGYLVDVDGFPVSLLNIATTPGIIEGQPDIASSDAMGGYIVAWDEEIGMGSDVYARRMSDAGVMEGVLEVATLSDYEERPAVAGGMPVPLAVWHSWNGGDFDVYGRFLYWQVYLPLALWNLE
jgi:hypothetical protein